MIWREFKRKDGKCPICEKNNYLLKCDGCLLEDCTLEWCDIKFKYRKHDCNAVEGIIWTYWETPESCYLEHIRRNLPIDMYEIIYNENI